MALIVLIASLFMLVTLAGMQAMLAIFAGAGLANKLELTPLQGLILGNSVWLLPALSIGTGIWLVASHMSRARRVSYWWLCLPIVCSALYLAYVVHLGG